MSNVKMKSKVKFGTRKAFEAGHQAWFSIDHQKFYLDPVEDKATAQWYVGNLKTAFKRLLAKCKDQ